MWLLHNQALYRFPHKLGGLPVALTKRWPPVPLIWDIRFDQPRGMELKLHLVWNPPARPGFPQTVAAVEINKRQIKPWREMDNYDITRFQLGMKDKAVDCFPLRSFFSLCWGTRSSRNGLAVPGVFLRAQIQCDRSVGNNWCVFLTEHFVNRKPGIYFLMKKKKKKSWWLKSEQKVLLALYAPDSVSNKQR